MKETKKKTNEVRGGAGAGAVLLAGAGQLRQGDGAAVLDGQDRRRRYRLL